ncbi:hypothetical protein AOL_s00215g887 [Orbilia oligospora ATCC 24927]|uniref:Uncharacterized protein n=2 Tax=Orbilia oligospora TaxID=2813651 RepID=G1XV79_ARTOA|nr:hypothetical protein AOL_s00215g887 [Orbilia oligospora ATCC 24927]EGX42938.1 hypothetical protein AOL_s00215g887 [Orbilia oligospora ATCC 24927]KAF3273897.1 hypothetical protein TWF970_008306 [Orbilia oligospora]
MNMDGIGGSLVDNRDVMVTEPSNASGVESKSGSSISPPASIVESVFSRVSSSSQYSVDPERHGILIYWMYPNQPSFWEDMAPIERVSLMTPFTDNLFYHELRRRAGFSRVTLIEGRFVKVLSFTIQQPPGPGGVIATGRMELVDIVSTVHQLAIENSDGGRAVSRIEELGYHHNPVVILVELHSPIKRARKAITGIIAYIYFGILGVFLRCRLIEVIAYILIVVGTLTLWKLYITLLS